METLTVTTCQAPNAEPACQAIAAYLGQKIGLPAEFINTIPWQERARRLLEEGQINVGWICGLPYVLQAKLPSPPVELLAAPVMAGKRYAGRPVYFSDVVVHRDSRFQTFADLRGAVWAYNEPFSHSGYVVPRYHLAILGETSGFFSRVVESGAHQRSLQLILERKADASAIDSTVLETELRNHPPLAAQLRVIASLGPSPIPPWVIQKSLPLRFKQAIRAVLLTMHTDPQGRVILAHAGITCFAPVRDRDYDPIRRMAQIAQSVQW